MSAIDSVQNPVYVYERPVRLWHWVNALALVVLAVTGYLIASPWSVRGGEASEHYLMGYVRFHFAASCVLAVGFSRVCWAWQTICANCSCRRYTAPTGGTAVARNQVVPVPCGTAQLCRGTIPHNMAMFLFYVLGALLMIVTGFALYGEGLGQGAGPRWSVGWFRFGQSQDVHTWHHVGHLVSGRVR